MRCQWQMKHGERVAAVKISSDRRKVAQKFWAPQQDIAAEIDTKNMPLAYFLNVSTPAYFLNVSTLSGLAALGHLSQRERQGLTPTKTPYHFSSNHLLTQ